jgi:hypothetical protein
MTTITMNRRTQCGALFGAALLVALLAGCSGGSRHSVLPSAGGGPGATGPAAGARKTRTINGASYQQVCAPPGSGRASCAAVIPLSGAPSHAGRSANGVRRTSSLPADTAPNFGWWPIDLVSAYGLPFDPAVGTGMTIAIVDAFDSPTVEADLAVYRAYFGLPPCTSQNGCFKKVNARGQQRNYPPSGAGTGWTLEMALDVEAASATCPNCKIVLVESNSDFFSDLAVAENTAAATGAQVISNSYYGPEVDPAPNPGDPPMTAFAPAYRHPGIVITAATGDFGFDEGFQTPSGAPFPAGLTNVVAAGGTQLGFSNSNARGWDEIAWGGSGGGCSTMFDKPSWQPAGACAHRLSADVSATADGLAVYDSADIGGGGWGVVGGTSASTPIIAGLFALGGNPSDMNGAASVYAHPRAMNDITAGPATGTCSPAYFCTPGVGYDGPTGMGTPNGTRAFGGTAPQWRSLAKSAVDVAANDTALWVLNDDGRVARYTVGSWQPVSVPGRPARLALSPNGTPYLAGRDGKLWTYDPSNGWTSLGCCVSDVAAGSAFPSAPDDVWVVTPTGAILENNGSGWNPQPGSATRIAASADGGIWIVDRSERAAQWSGTSWTVTGCCFSDIGAANGNLAYAIGDEHESVWRFDGSSWSRVRASGAAISVTPARGVPFVVDDDESLLFYD